MGLSQSGKAILTVEKDGDGDSSSSLYVSINCLTGIDKNDHGGQDWLQRSASEFAAYYDWLPNQCYRMEHGDVLVFKVNFYQSYTRGDGWTTDDDEDLEFYNVRKLYERRGANETRKARKQYYQPKSKLKYGGKVKLSKKQMQKYGWYESDGVYLE